VHPTQSDFPAGARRKGKGYAWAALAALTCPCHVPIYALLLSGTALGAAVAQNLALAFAVFAGVFLIALVFALRLLKHDRADGKLGVGA